MSLIFLEDHFSNPVQSWQLPAAALEVYRYAKANGTVAGLDNLVDEMGQRFAQQSGRGRSAAARSTNGSSTTASGS